MSEKTEYSGSMKLMTGERVRLTPEEAEALWKKCEALYPKNWPTEIVPAIRRRSGNRCELCGVPNGELGGRSPAGIWHKARPLGEKLLRLEWPKEGEYAPCEGYDQPLRIVRIVLTVMHLNHDPTDNRPENLKHGCQRCHNRYDLPHRRKNAAATRRARLAAGDLFEGAKV